MGQRSLRKLASNPGTIKVSCPASLFVRPGCFFQSCADKCILSLCATSLEHSIPRVLRTQKTFQPRSFHTCSTLCWITLNRTGWASGLSVCQRPQEPADCPSWVDRQILSPAAPGEEQKLHRMKLAQRGEMHSINPELLARTVREGAEACLRKVEAPYKGGSDSSCHAKGGCLEDTEAMPSEKGGKPGFPHQLCRMLPATLVCCHVHLRLSFTP